MNIDSEARKRLINPDLYEPIERYGEQSYEVTIGNTVFQVKTHYNLYIAITYGLIVP